MINTARNRALPTDLFAAFGREGWGEVFLAALRDDVVFNAMGRSPIAGHYEGKRVYGEALLEKLHDRLFVRPTLVVDKIIVDGDIPNRTFRHRRF
jgi:ketosteroid isomerase-like protein